MPAEATAGAVTCGDAAAALAGLADNGWPAPPEVTAHVATCLRCQAEVARYRRLLRHLHALRFELVPPAPGLVSETIGAVEAEMARVARRAHMAMAAYVGGAVVATAASAAGVLVWATRRRVPLAS